MIEEGIYEAKIVNARVEVDEKLGGELSLAFNLLLENGSQVTARHRTGGEWGHIGRDVAESLGVKWPDGLETIHETAGKSCQVKIKHKEGRNGQTFENAYIHIARGNREPATEDQVKAGIAKLKKDDNTPF